MFDFKSFNAIMGGGTTSAHRSSRGCTSVSPETCPEGFKWVILQSICPLCHTSCSINCLTTPPNHWTFESAVVPFLQTVLKERLTPSDISKCYSNQTLIYGCFKWPYQVLFKVDDSRYWCIFSLEMHRYWYCAKVLTHPSFLYILLGQREKCAEIY